MRAEMLRTDSEQKSTTIINKNKLKDVKQVYCV